MTEITVTTNKIQHLASGSLHIWGWEVPVYLFLGGLTAGILIIVAWMILRYKDNEKTKSETGRNDFSFTINRLILGAPVALSLGMLALFFDLDHKLYVWRFYTSFQVTSPMSWGAWVLLLVYPVSIFIFLATFREGYPRLANWLDTFFASKKFLKKVYGKVNLLIDFCRKHLKLWARLSIPIGIVLGIYTGILLSAFSARPFWNSSIMGPLFLVSGLSTAAALIVLFSRKQQERHFFTRIDLVLIGIEVSILILFIIGMLSSTQQHQEAVRLILGGELTASFWVLIIGLGLLLPAFLEIMELRGKKIPSTIAATLVLVGGLLLRFIVVEAGQISTWVRY